MGIKRMLTAIHLWVGELLGLTHYRNCHTCLHRSDESTCELVWCDLYFEEHEVLAATDPSEAVWCHDYEPRPGSVEADLCNRGMDA